MARCYSLSSAPHEGRHQITVKRTADGYASRWIVDNLRAGDTVRVLPPTGIFTPKSLEEDLLLFAGGSGITPVLSIARTALERGERRVVLFYANRDEHSVNFGEALTRLSTEHPERFLVVHWLESVQGLPSRAQLQAFASYFSGYEAFVCGPAPFMASVTESLKALGFPRSRRHQEKFVSLGGNPFGDVEEIRAAAASLAEVVGPVAVEVDLDGQHDSFDDWQGDKALLDFLEEKGLDPPFSCRMGQCSACACLVLEGEVRLVHNAVLRQEDLDAGIRLACQSLPASEKLRISYNGQPDLVRSTASQRT